MAENKLTFDQNGFYLDGKPFRMYAGDLHYFRIHPDDWERRLSLAVDFGLNTIQTYVPWNLHEKKAGEYCFEGILDLAAFLAACQKQGLYVLLRPAPYICSEWDLGGLPARLLANKDMTLRSSDPAYLAEVRRYYEALVPVFRPYLATNGGPILAVALENEYGSYDDDHAYIDALADMLRENGVDVPFYTTDGPFEPMMMGGTHGSDFIGVNYRALAEQSALAFKNLRESYPDGPFFVGEFWAGRGMNWGEPFYHRAPEEVPTAYREALELGGNVCFYMFSGGTNFGPMGGANFGRSYSPRPNTPARYIPMMTSYDADALLREDGEPTEKYFRCRDVLDEYLGRPKRPHTTPIPAREKQTLTVSLTEAAYLLDDPDAVAASCVKETTPRYMEDHGQAYGLILYSIDTKGFRQTEWDWTLRLQDMKDRAEIYMNGAYYCTYMRDRGVKTAGAPVTGTGASALAVWRPTGEDVHFDVLVENMGRINFAHHIENERKGMRGLLYGDHRFSDCTTRTIPLDDLSRLVYRPYTASDFKPHQPVFLRGRFDAKGGVDTYVCTEGFGHGYVFVNGISLGRFDEAGPQYALYLPGGWLRDRDNEIVVLDIDPKSASTEISMIDRPIIEGEGKELS